MRIPLEKYILISIIISLSIIFFIERSKSKRPYQFRVGDKIILDGVDLKGIVKNTGRENIKIITEYGMEIVVSVDLVRHTTNELK